MRFSTIGDEALNGKQNPALENKNKHNEPRMNQEVPSSLESSRQEKFTF
jgi:hypothetical protein